MGYAINGVTANFPIPNIAKKKYKYAKFPQPFKMQVKENGKDKEITIDVAARIKTAWRFVSDQAKLKACNEYFRTLPRKLTLKQVLDEGEIRLHLLEPKEGYNFDDLPGANAAGRDIGLHPGLFFEDEDVLTATLIHELAHVAGASTDSSSVNAGAAELALKSCGCGKRYDKDNLGLLKLPETRLA